DVRLAVYDVLGREVAVLVDARQEAGAHRATFDASGLAAGTYVYRLVVGSEVQTGRLTLAH
ncbi:MAG TPA: T9SS type A sorting domain-containing protein, partial [Rubricoccaceae bacterium]|nr:T9SS type A sorting domain-containing protein [Rubricoccaceae bacterium]